mmetsp:Transcript_5453/g.6379  ORF Transcript_5453/g.6379 Transcript_5453/m.6379 type:complete len:403 (-) Transcript_5453:54-1262(-)
MKFCKNLQRIVDVSDPEWAPYWTNYKMLKKIIKELPSHVPADDICDFSDGDRRFNNAISTPAVSSNNHSISRSSSCSSVSRSSSCSSVSSVPVKMPTLQQNGDKTKEDKIEIDGANQTKVSRDMGKSPGEVAFFKLLHAELKKASYFFERAQQEFSIREERIREGVEIMSRPSSIMVNKKWSCLAKSLYRLYKDLLLLETFAIMSYCSFSKILKKHDKVTGYRTRAAFMANVVSKASFTNYPKVLEMIRRCESSYEEVSRYLVDEGNVDLCEDERLFINMIHRLNRQIIDKATKEGEAPFSQLRESHKERNPGLASAPPRTKFKSNCKVTFSLQSLVEENEADSGKNCSATCCVSSDDHDDVCSMKDAIAKRNNFTLFARSDMKRGIKSEKNASESFKRPKI